MKQPYWNLDLIHLSAESSAVYLDKEFILMDSLDGTVENESMSWKFTNYPVKLSFTIVIFLCSRPDADSTELAGFRACC